ncbi:hypothetical protein HPT25_05385 [Bacillus sp. BRMEA1]|nr:hypothetical protein [Neobacillus endophyticus]
MICGCTDKEIIFSGESKHWEGNYTVHIDGNNENGNYTFHYKNGDGKTKFKTLEVNVDDGKMIKKEDNIKGATIQTSSSCSGCSVTREDEPIKVKIKWNDSNEETFYLKTK